MSTNDTEPNPWTRPPFITAAIVIAIIVMLGAALAVRALTTDNPDPAAAPTAPASTAPPSPTPTTPANTDAASVCGLTGHETSSTVTIAPETEWAFLGTTAYPTSSKLGPGAVTDGGVHYCFQHSAEGALIAAANALVQAADPALSRAWAEHFVSSGPQREAILAETTGSSTAGSDVRMNISGFRMLAYDGDVATVDVAIRGSSGGTPVVGSFVYELVWQDGDWKLDASSPTPFRFAAIPDLAGYVTWGA